MTDATPTWMLWTAAGACFDVEGERLGDGTLLTVTDSVFTVSASLGDCTW